MKIGIVIDELVSGGFQKVALMEVKYLKQLGHDAVLVVLHRIKNEGYQDLIKENGIEVVRISDRLPWFLKINFRFPLFSFFSFFHVFYPFFIDKYVKKDKFDLLVVHGTYTAFSAIAIKKRLHIPLISYIHDSVAYIMENKYKNSPLRHFSKFIFFVAKKIDKKIIENSTSVIAYPDMIVEMKKICPDYAYYQEIFNGCEVISEDKINFKKAYYVIAVTKWDQGKNLPFLLDIWNKLETKTPLKVIGSFHPVSLENEIRELIKERGLSNFVEIVGKVSEKELYRYYQNAKFLVHPCREAFGMTILEASANGCPAIFTNNSGVAALYDEVLRKKFPEENDLAGYIKSITELFQLSQEAYEDLIREYYKTTEKNSWTSHCEKIVKVANV